MRIEGEKQEPPEKVNSLEYLQHIYRDPTQSHSVRMRAAIEALPFENPRVTAVAVGRLEGQDFASRLERTVEASERAKLIELRPEPTD